MDKRLGQISQLAPAFSAALRGYRAASTAGDSTTAEALLAWVSGQPNVAAAAKRSAGIKGEVDHFGLGGPRVSVISTSMSRTQYSRTTV